MAASTRVLACSQTRTLFSNRIHPVFAVPVRTSVYHKGYREPIVDKTQLEELEAAGETKELKFVPIKAALSDVTSSVFYDPVLHKFINMLMRKGQKALATRNVESALFNVKKMQLTKYHREQDPDAKESIECNPVTILHKALENCRPVVELSPIKRGGITYQVPIPMTPNRARFLSMKWMLDAANDKDQRVPFEDQLAKEIMDAFNNQGRVVKKKHELHKQCEANKAYAHYRWS
ncbi:hypothetical protein HPB47_011361 [Ixodes persulcatus]|uniref:Uncharacterized protein n=1 Tax=Ixodes persulcatus TaxID=34615 RepID=A0AC60NWM1_IXOPE|nr:hypothetical protein HPB47_011361 [Ixodes persulcatus]